MQWDDDDYDIEDFDFNEDDLPSKPKNNKKRDNNLSLDLETWKILIEERIEAVLLKYGIIEKDKLPEARRISIKELSFELGVSRQTIHNWSNHRYYRQFILPFRIHVGK